MTTAVTRAIRLRPMTQADLPAVLQIEAQVQPFPWREGHFADSLAAGHLCRVLTDEPGDEILAYAILMPLPDEVELLTIAVAAAHQRKGLGRACLLALAEAARGDGHQAIFLEVAGRNLAAQRLYEQLGFVQIGLRRNYYHADDGSTDDARVMRLALRPAADEADAGKEGADV